MTHRLERVFAFVCLLALCAGAFAQTPAVPAQPANLGTYGFEKLALFPVYTRASYLAKFGTQAPSFDVSKPPKYWFDSSAGNDPRTYNVPDPGARVGESGEKQLTMSAAAAAAVNIPGLVSYPQYVVAPMGAVQNGTGAVPDPNYFSYQQDAIRLALQWGVSPSMVVDTDPTGTISFNFQPGELRRTFGIIYNGQAQNVGIALLQEYSKGIGHPGHWDFSAGYPQWVNDADPPDGITAGVPQAGTEVPVPVRPLLSSEAIQRTLMGAEIVNTNLLQTPSTSSSEFGDKDRATLASLQNSVAALNAAMAKILGFLKLN